MFNLHQSTNKLTHACSCVVAMAGLVMVGALLPPSANASDSDVAPTNITFMLDFSALGRHAPWYVAKAKGYYKQAGLNVKIVPGEGTAQSVQALEAGVAQIAFSDVTALVLGRARGVSTAKMVAMSYHKAPYAIFSLRDGADITKASQLEGLTIASSASSNTPKIIQGLMTEKGLDPSSVTFTNVSGSARPAMLLTGQVPAIETFVFGKAGMERHAKKGELKTFLLADHGLSLYSDGVIVKKSYLQSHPKVVRAFLAASMKGWKFALSHIKKAATLELKYVPSLDKQTVIGELKMLQNLAITPTDKKKGIGYMDPHKMKKSVDFITKYIGVSGNVPPVKSLYTNKFLPDPPVLP